MSANLPFIYLIEFGSPLRARHKLVLGINGEPAKQLIHAFCLSLTISTTSHLLKHRLDVHPCARYCRVSVKSLCPPDASSWLIYKPPLATLCSPLQLWEKVSNLLCPDDALNISHFAFGLLHVL